jgi:hypothetical protein
MIMQTRNDNNLLITVLTSIAVAAEATIAYSMQKKKKAHNLNSE